VYFVLANTIPGFRDLINLDYSWPVIILLVAAGLLLLGLLVGAPDMAVPAFIVGGIGGILYYQNTFQDWGSWSYMWTLIPGFSGLGMLAAWLFGARERYSIRSALDALGTSFVLFAVFGAIFGAFKQLGNYWPVLLIAAGVLLALRGLVKPRDNKPLGE
jgi:hypothetical protein